VTSLHVAVIKAVVLVSVPYIVFHIVWLLGIDRADFGTRLNAMGWPALVYMHTMLLYCSNCIVNQLPSLIGAFFLNVGVLSVPLCNKPDLQYPN